MQNTKKQVSALRAKRVAALQVALLQKRVANKQAKYQAAMHAYQQQQQALANQQAYLAEIAQIQAKYGVSATITAAPRANSATPQPSASAILVNGTYLKPVAAVHALAAIHKNRKATLVACAQAGINPATAATQWGVYKKQHGL